MKESSKESKERKKATTAAAVSAGAGAYAQGGDADVERFINLFNGEMVRHSASIPTIYRLTPGYVRMLRALLREHSWENVEKMVTMAAESDFLNGGGQRGFKADLEWLTREQNFLKVVNGKYCNIPAHRRWRDPAAVRASRMPCGPVAGAPPRACSASTGCASSSRR